MSLFVSYAIVLSQELFVLFKYDLSELCTLPLVQDKLEKQHASNHRTVSELETKLAQAEAFNEAMQKYVREIEQANDDLERAKR